MSEFYEKYKRKREEENKKRSRRSIVVILIVAAAAAAIFGVKLMFDRNTARDETSSSAINSTSSAVTVETPMAAGIKDAIKESEDIGYELMLINSTSHLPADFAPSLDNIDGGFKLDEKIASSANALLQKALNDNVPLLVNSAYRSLEQQVKFYQSQSDLTYEQAFNLAKASEHPSGLSLDFVSPDYRELDDGFENTEAFKWLEENAHIFGFILRYPKDKRSITNVAYKPYHFRYVGAENATQMKKNNFCLEEYIQYIRSIN